MAKRGRRPRGVSPMPPVTVTALPEELLTLMLLGDGSTSFGLQKAIRRLIDSDPEIEGLFAQAIRIREHVIGVLEERGDEVTEREIYRYGSANFYDLAEMTSRGTG